MKPVRTLGFDMSVGSARYQSEQNAKVLAGNVSFGSTTSNATQDQNIQCHKATGTTPVAPSTDFPITHSLGRVPIGYIVIKQDAYARFKVGATAWTANTIYLQCDTSNVAYTIIVL